MMKSLPPSSKWI